MRGGQGDDKSEDKNRGEDGKGGGMMADRGSGGPGRGRGGWLIKRQGKG